MRMLFLLLLMIAALVVALATLNWSVIVVPNEVSLGFMSVQMPLGLVLLGLMGTLALASLACVVYLQGSALLDARRLTKEVLASRDLADKAEASRFTALQGFMADAMKAQQEQVLGRISELESRQQTLLEQTGNALAASLGELDDRLERQGLAGHRPVP